MANIVSSDLIVAGTDESDIILAVGGVGANTVNGGGGSDLIFGDHIAPFADAGAGNGTIATAIGIDAAANWSIRANPDVGDPSVPYTTVLATGAGERDVYAVTLAAGATLTADVDAASGFFADLSILAADGTVLATTLSGGAPSPDEGRDSFGGGQSLVYISAAAQTVYIEIFEFLGVENGPVPAGATYMLNVSATGHANSAAAAFGADVLNGGADDDILYGIDGDDQLNGGDGRDQLVGGAGNDQANGGAEIDLLFGEAGNDALNGGEQDDFLYGGAGNDALDGGSGFDTVVYQDRTTPIVLALAGGAVATAMIGGVAEDTLRLVENIVGGSGSDTLSGDANANQLQGNAGNDLLRGGAGLDTLDGGPGGDGADYRDQVLAVAVVLNGFDTVFSTLGGVTADALRSIENVYGGPGGDFLGGDAAGNVLAGNDGNDLLRGGGGADRLFGGAGLDSADYREKTATVVVTLNGGVAVDVFVGGVAEDQVRDIEFIYGGSAADTLTGDALANTFRGGGGADLIDGAGGIDGVDFRDKIGAVVLKLNGGIDATATVGGVAEDVVRNVEIVFGGSGADGLTGDAFANQLFGGAGQDRIRGAGGGDVLAGGAGNDLFIYGSALSESTVAAGGRDRISDFAAGDRIDLRLIDANTTAGAPGDQAFTLGAMQNGTPGRLQVTAIGGGQHLVEADVNGDGGADFALVVVAAVPPAGPDFLL